MPKAKGKGKAKARAPFASPSPPSPAFPPAPTLYTSSSADGHIRRHAWRVGYNYLVSRQQRKTGVVIYLCNPDAANHACPWQVRLTPTIPSGMFLIRELAEHSEVCSQYHNNPKFGELPKDTKEKMVEIRKESPHLAPSEVNAQLTELGLGFPLIKITEVWNNMKRVTNPKRPPPGSDTIPTAQDDTPEPSSSGPRAEAVAVKAAPRTPKSTAKAVTTVQSEGSVSGQASARASGGKGKKKRVAISEPDDLDAQLEATPPPPKIRRSGRGGIPGSKKGGT